jgi:hypothetical protein
VCAQRTDYCSYSREGFIARKVLVVRTGETFESTSFNPHGLLSLSLTKPRGPRSDEPRRFIPHVCHKRFLAEIIEYLNQGHPLDTDKYNPGNEAALAATRAGKMGACMSSNQEELDQKKRSQAIDKKLEEDSRRLRRECKILLLGMPNHYNSPRWAYVANNFKVLERVENRRSSSR